jgi:hypothetical protein
MRVSPNDGVSFSGVTGFPGSNGGDTATTYTSDGRLFWVNIASPGLAIQEMNPTTGALIGASHAVDNGGGADDKPFVAADPTIPGSLYVTWTAFLAQTEVLVRHSTDFGATWSAAVRADSGSDGFVWPASVTVDSSHFVYVAYHSVLNFTGNNPSNGDGAVFVTRYNSNLTGPVHTTAVTRGFADITYNVQTAPQTRVIPGAQFWIQGAGQPWVLADPARPGNIYVVAADSNNFANDFGDIRISRSTNFGATWSAPTLISGGPNHTEYFPNAAIDRFGDVVVAWYDDRRGLVNGAGRHKLDVFAKYSTDGGVTFSSDFAVNDQTPNVNTTNGNVFDPDVGAVQRFSGPPPTTRIGEYFGLAIWGGTAYVVWNGNSFSGFNNPVGEQVWTKAFAIRGSLTVTGTAGNDTITIRNMANNANFVEVIVNGQRQYAGLWSALTGITVAATAGNDTVNIEDSASGVPITVNEGSGTDTVNVSPTAQFLDHIQANLNIGFGPGVDTLNVFDQNDGFNDTYTMNANSMTRTSSALISYAGQNFVNINGGTGNVTYNVNGTEAGWATTLNTGTGADTVNVLATSGTLAVNAQGGGGNDVVNLGNAGSVSSIQAAVTLENEPSFNTVNIFDQSDTTAHTATLDSFTPAGESLFGRLQGIGAAPITWDYNDTSAVNINFGIGTTVVNVLGTGVTTNLFNRGTPTINVGNANSVSGIQGTLNLENEPSFDTVNINDQNDGSFGAATIDTVTRSGDTSLGRLQGIGAAPITWDYIDTTVVNINFGLGGVSATVLGTGVPTNLNGNAAATNTLVGGNVNTTWNITGTNAGTISNVNVFASFTSFQNLTGGSASNTFFLSDGVGVSGTINGGSSGNNQLNESAYTTPVSVDLTANTATGVGGGIANLQGFVGGSAGGNTLNGPAANTTWIISFTNGGSLTGGFSFQAYQNLTGGAGDNTFAFFSPSGAISGLVTGGGGTNTLDYSAYTASVIVDLQTGQATATGSEANIVNVLGGTSAGPGLYNLLIGNGGNVLTGGSGRRNILVAGATASTLNAGNGEDLLIGGTTTYDTEAGLVSWQAIAAYWAGGDPFTTRVTNVETGNGVPVLDNTVVTGNGGSNVMNGSGGLALIYTDGLDAIGGFDPGSILFPIAP